MTTSPASKSMFSVCLFLVLTLLSLFNPQHADASRTVKAGIYNFKPMVYSDTDGSAQGFFVKILNHIAQKENWNVQYVPGTWQEGLDRLKSDQIDLLLCIGYTDARDNYLDFPKEFLLLDWGTIYKAKGSSINSIFDLEGKTVSILKGSMLPAGFQELINQFNIHVTMKEMDQASEVLASVVSGSADAGVAANLSGILNKAWQKVERTPIIFTPSKLGFAVNEGKNGDLIAVLDREIATIKSDKSSIYYRELEYLLGNKEHKIPKEAYWVLSGIFAALLLALAWNIILKRQVRAKTEHLESEVVERKQIEKIRSNEKAFLRSLIDSADDLIYFKDCNGKYIGSNKASEKFIGFSEDEQIGKSDFDLLDHELADKVLKNDKMVMESNIAIRFEEWVTRSDGSRVLLDTIKAPIVTPDRQILGLVGISRDITERKEIEGALRENEERYRLLVNNLSAGLVIHAPDTSITFSNPMASTLLGLTQEQMQGKVAIDPAWCFLREDGTSFPLGEYPVNQVLSTGKPISNQVLGIKRPDLDEPVWVKCNSYPVSDENGQLAQVVVTFSDITELKNAEDVLRKSESRFRLLVENAPDAVFVRDRKCFTYINNAALTLFGADSAEELLGTPIIDRYHPIVERSRYAAGKPSTSDANSTIKV